ncbi:MAG: response regulator [Deltaproteobacteria bacterium]|nr:response regulator [Deltaproteobacteria bacterium]
MHKFLITEDEAVIAIELEKTLVAMGHEVVGTAGSGHKAVEMARRLKPDLILMDIVMPGDVDGIAAAEIIKEEMDISVIFLTAYAGDQLVERAKRVRPLGYIVKPFQEDQVRATIKIAIYNQKIEKALRKAHDELEVRVEERTAELRKLSGKLLDAEEHERKRIAGELHDSIGQSLSAIKFGLENAIAQNSEDPANGSGEVLKALIPVVQQASEELRQIHTDLRPPLLDDLGILTTISWFCREFEKLHSPLKIEKRMDMEEKDVPEAIKIVIFRVLQEALNNVAKHANAEAVRVSLTGTDGQIELVVEDNGQGFDVEQVSSAKAITGGFGLTSMKERAELSEGTFVVDSTPGGGTAIRVSWPM